MKTARRQGRIFFFVLLAVFLAAPSYGVAKEKTLGVFGAWHAFVSNEGGQTVCYMVTTKRINAAPFKKRGTPYVMITHRPIEASTDVFSYGAGVMLDTRKPVRLVSGKNSFELFSVRDIAWARDSRTDHKIVAALKKAPTLKLSAFATKKPAAITDIFDMAQAPAAYRAIGKACGLPDETPKKPAPHPQKPLKHTVKG